MPNTTVIAEAVELLLSAAFNTRQDGRQTSFMFSQADTLSHQFIGGAEVHYSKFGLLRAALHVRSRGPLYLRNLSLNELESKLTDFLIEKYAYIAEEVYFYRGPEPLAGLISKTAKAQIATALAASDLFSPRDLLTVFPIVPVRVEADFDSSTFFLVRPESLTPSRIGDIFEREVVPTQFPPTPDWKGRRETPACWLGVRSPTVSTSKKLRSAILGAVALLPHPRERHMFTGRKVFGGRATFDRSWTISFGDSHTPRLSEDVVIVQPDHVWLQMLSVLLVDATAAARKKVKALEYYYRAWALDEVERFPILFMSIDAIFGDASQATQAVIDAIGPIMGPTYDYDRLRLLLSLRASVVHGGAPDVYESSKYIAYFERYNEDPIFDMELIVARCLQSVVFSGTLASRPHTYADLLKQARGIDTEA